MIAWQRYGSVVFYSSQPPFADTPSITPPVIYFNGSLFFTEIPYSTNTVYTRLRAGSMNIEGYRLGVQVLAAFMFGTKEYAVFGSRYTGAHYGGYLESETGERWPINTTYWPLSASIVKTDYGIVIGLAGYTTYNLHFSAFGFDGHILRTIQNFSPVGYGSLSSYKVSTLVFALGGKYAYIAVARQYYQTFEAYIVDTTTWQASTIDSAFNNLASFCSIGLVHGSLKNAFSNGVVEPFNNFAFVTVPRWYNDDQETAVCLMKPRADNLFEHVGVEFSLPIDNYYSTPTPFGVFFANRNAVIYCNPITSVNTILSPTDLNVIRFVSPVVYFTKGSMQGSFLLVGYSGPIGTNFMLTVFIGTLTMPLAIGYEQNLLYPAGGSSIGYPQFIFKPAASAMPSEFEIFVTEKTRRTTNVFASYSDRTFFEYSLDGTSWIRMTGPIVANGTTLVRFAPPVMLPPGTYEWQVRRIAFGG